MGKTVLITGASSGIGRASAIGLARQGYNLVICARSEERLEETVFSCAGAEDRVLALACDVTDEASVVEMFGAAKEKFSHLDVVFNNAGRFLPASRIDETSLETFRSGLDVNLVGSFLVARQAFRQMKDQDPRGGRIINNGSISAHVPRPNSVTYNAAKSAISGLTKSISLEGRPFNIACSQIDIGNAATQMTKKMQTGVLQANGTIAPEPTFDVKHVVDAVIYMAGLPLNANVQFMNVMATNMPYIGRG